MTEHRIKVLREGETAGPFQIEIPTEFIVWQAMLGALPWWKRFLVNWTPAWRWITLMLPYTIWSVDEGPVPVYTKVTNILAANEHKAMHDFLAERAPTDEKFVARPYNSPPRGRVRPSDGSAL